MSFLNEVDRDGNLHIDTLNGHHFYRRSTIAREMLVSRWHCDFKAAVFQSFFVGLNLVPLDNKENIKNELKPFTLDPITNRYLHLIVNAWITLCFKDQDEYNRYAAALSNKIVISRRLANELYPDIKGETSTEGLEIVFKDFPLMMFLFTIALTGPLTPDEQLQIAENSRKKKMEFKESDPATIRS